MEDMTQADIDNGMLNRALAKVGISDVQNYIQSFNQKTEQLMKDEDAVVDSSMANQDHSTLSPADVQNWMEYSQLRQEDSNQSPLVTEHDSSSASLDIWIKSLIPPNAPSQIKSPKKRLTDYLNVLQKVLASHNSNVTYEPAPFGHTTATKPATEGIGSVKHMYSLWKVLDKNNDGKITVADVQIMLQKLGWNRLSNPTDQSLIQMLDSDHDGSLTFHDFIALISIIKKLYSDTPEV